MRRRFSYWRLFVIAYFLSHCAAVSHADSCVMFHKRAPVQAVCGRIANVAGERLNGVEVTLTDETGSVLFRERSDAKGKFFFGSLPKRDYAGAPETLPFGFRVPKARLYPLLDQRAFELGHGSNDLKHQPAGWCAEVEIVPQTDETESQRLQFSQSIDQVPKGTARNGPVSRPARHRNGAAEHLP